MRYRAFNIVWETDGEDVPHLPCQAWVEVEDDEEFDAEDLPSAIADQLSDEYGYCMEDFDYEEVVAPEKQ